MKAPRKLKKKVKLYLQAKNEKSTGFKVKITLIHFDLKTETYTYNCKTFMKKKLKSINYEKKNH
jgi:hypothetical protein